MPKNDNSKTGTSKIRERRRLDVVLRSLRTAQRKKWQGLAKRGVEMRKASHDLVRITERGLEQCRQKNIGPSYILDIFFNEDFYEISGWLLENTEDEKLRLLLIKAKILGSDSRSVK